MKFKSLLVISASILILTGCGEDPEAPIPTLSQDETVLDKKVDEKSQKDGGELTGKNVDGAISDETIVIGDSNISVIDGSNVDSSQNESENTPILIGEDVEYINTQFDSIYFDFDRYSIKESMLVSINRNLQLINSPRVTGKDIIIEGNCDEWGTDEYNYALGLKRAQVVREALIADGVNEDRVKAISYGESNPVCLEEQDDCWAKNRRVDFKLEE